MTERLFTIAVTAWKLTRDNRTGGMIPHIAVGIVTGWSESQALAREVGIGRARAEMPAAKGFRDHDANVRAIEPERLAEWAEQAGWSPPETVFELRAEIARLRKRKRSARELLEFEDESEVLV